MARRVQAILSVGLENKVSGPRLDEALGYVHLPVDRCRLRGLADLSLPMYYRLWRTGLVFLASNGLEVRLGSGEPRMSWGPKVVLGWRDIRLDRDLRIEIASEATEELATSMSLLLAQLSSSKVDFDRRVLAQMIECDTTDVFIATQSNDVVGTLTLLVGRIPTGTRCFIEDVVVDSKARGSGLGEALVRAALDRAQERGAKTVDLTSRPDRDAANRLYLRCGFALRDTNVYRYQLSDLAGRNVR